MSLLKKLGVDNRILHSVGKLERKDRCGFETSKQRKLCKTMRALKAKLMIAAVALATCATPAFAAGDLYRLAAGDSLFFSILSFPDLSRTVQVGVDGRVFLPIVGSLSVEGRSLDEIRSEIEVMFLSDPLPFAELTASGQAGSLDAARFMIDIAEYRPVYISGAVANPGQVQFRPGMTVRQATVISGGIGLAREGTDESRLLSVRRQFEEVSSEIAARNERIERLRRDLAQVLQENDGDAEVLSSPSVIEDDITEQWLEARAAQRSIEAQQLTATLGQLVERLTVLRELQRISEATTTVREAEYERLLDLRSRGISTENAVRDAQEGVLQASSRALETSAELLRLESLISETQSLDASKEINSWVELIEAIDRELFELSRLNTRKTALNRDLLLYGQAAENDEEEAAPVIIYLRYPGGGGDEPIPVEPGDVLAPGDVIEVVITETADENK